MWNIVLLLFLLLAAGLIVGVVLGLQLGSCNNIKQAIKFESLELELEDYSSDIYDNYALSSNAYDISDYPNTILYCEMSRKLSNTYSQRLRRIKAEYPEELSEILEVRKEMLDTEIAYLFALYESCEYIESAARAYEIESYETGDSNIEGQNKAIQKHDDLVEDYFQLSADYLKLRQELAR